MNAHIVLQQFQAEDDVHQRLCKNIDESDEAFLLPLSAKSPESLAATVSKWSEYLDRRGHSENRIAV